MNDSPVTILGCQRSGTTILMRLLSYHPSFAWVSQYLNSLPPILQLGLLSRFCDLPIIGSYLKRNYSKNRMIPKPVEPGSFMSNIDSKFHKLRAFKKLEGPLFSRPTRSIIKEYRQMIEKLLVYHGKQRFISKHTTKPDALYFAKIFPNASFVHLVRDGKAVVNSLNNKYLREGWFPKAVRRSIMTLFPEDYIQFIEKSQYETLSFFTCYYCLIVNTLNKQMSQISSERTLLVRYENLTENPFAEFKRIADSLDIPWCDEFMRYFQFHNLENRNYKVKRDLSPDEIQSIESALGRFLNRAS